MSDELIPQYKPELSLEQLQARVEQLERQLLIHAIDIEGISKRVPDSNIISPNFLKRAFTVWGHYVVAGFIIAIPMFCIMMTLALLTGLFSQY